MQNQSNNVKQLKKSLEEFSNQINQLLLLSKKDASKLTHTSLEKIVENIEQIDIKTIEMQKEDHGEELDINLILIRGFINHEFYINKNNTMKTSLIALKTLQSESHGLDKFQQMLSFWNKERELTQVLLNNLHNIIEDLAA